MYKTCTKTVEVCVDSPYGTEDNFWVNGIIKYEVSITRDFGNYGGRSDDYSGDPDEVVIEGVESYNLWISNNKKDSEGTEFDSNDCVQILDDDFLIGLADSEELEVQYDED